ncbi:MAG: sugar ABC transporter substrate-binding protein, partial [Agrococcus casei]
MKKKLFGAMALATVAGLVLAGCGTGREDTSGDGDGTDGGAGFDADARIGVALPDKTSENWVLA